MYQVLLIDDDPNIVDGLKKIIEESFPEIFQIDRAFDGFQALTLLTEHYYHLIISDIKMPQLDGLRLLELIHSGNIPSFVIMLSGYDDYSYIRSALKMGAYDYLLKPVAIHTFVSMIHSLLPQFVDSSSTLSLNHLSIPSPAKNGEYFDVESSGAILTHEQLDSLLKELQTSILALKEEDLEGITDRIFRGLSPTVFSREDLRRIFSDFLYTLMQQNSSLIPIVAHFKLSDNDLSAQIKNLPHLSQLKKKFSQVLSLYVEQLKIQQAKNDAYIVKKARAYIDQHYSESLMLADIASRFRLHPNYFSFLFKKQMNITVRDYILQVRIQKAKELMENPSLKLLDIALAVGYQDAAHFNRAFKNVTGLSPSRYRESIRLN